jgi:hypothetical protein
MMKDIVDFVNGCELRQQMKNPPARRTRVPYLTRPQPSRPWEIASMDKMHFPSANKCRYILIIVDLSIDGLYPLAYKLWMVQHLLLA